MIKRENHGGNDKISIMASFALSVVQLCKISLMTTVMYTKIEEKVNTKSGRLDSTEKGSARLNTASLNYRVLKTEYLMLTV